MSESGVSASMRAALLVLFVASPAFGQTPAELDAQCADHSVPTVPSYEPPPWLGDAPPTHTSAAAASATARTLRSQLTYNAIQPTLWAQLGDAYRDQCLLGDGGRAVCRSAASQYSHVISVQLQNPSTAFPSADVMFFRVAMVDDQIPRSDRVRRTLELLVSRFPLSALRTSALIFLGRTYEREGNIAAARDYYEEAAEKPSPEQALALYLAAWAARAMSDDDDASRFAEQALTTATGQLEQGLRQDWCALHTPSPG